MIKINLLVHLPSEVTRSMMIAFRDPLASYTTSSHLSNLHSHLCIFLFLGSSWSLPCLCTCHRRVLTLSLGQTALGAWKTLPLSLCLSILQDSCLFYEPPSPLVSWLSLPLCLQSRPITQSPSSGFSHRFTCTDLTSLAHKCPKPRMACACPVSFHPALRDSSSFTLHIETGAVSVVPHRSLWLFPLGSFSVFHPLVHSSFSFEMLIKYCLLCEATKSPPTTHCMSFSLSLCHMCPWSPVYLSPFPTRLTVSSLRSGSVSQSMT